MSFKRIALRGLIVVAITAASGCAPLPYAQAQSPDPQYDQRDAAIPDVEPPSIAGRLSLIDGDVRILQQQDASQPEQQGWQQAIPNDVVTNGTSLYTGPGSRGEVQLAGHALRLDESSQVTMQQVDDRQSVVQLDGGVINLRWNDGDRGTSAFRVIIPDGAVDLLGSGRYRIDLHQDGATVTVFEGRAQVTQGGNTVPVAANRSLTATSGRFTFGAVENTVFDQWALARDNRVRASVASRYVSPAMTGAEDLDAYGRWNDDPDYGALWYPSAVPAGWAPYRNGQWRWVPPWGWTWVDAAPWGFAPFHYGRWVQVGGGWAWAPGAYVARPVYAPALVGYNGYGSGVGFSLTIRERPSAWYPLSPWQPYRPWYSRNPGYANNVNRGFPRHDPPPHWHGTPNEQGGWSRDPGHGGGRPVATPPPPPSARANQPGQQNWRGGDRGHDRGNDRGDNRPPTAGAQPPAQQLQQPQDQRPSRSGPDWRRGGPAERGPAAVEQPSPQQDRRPPQQGRQPQQPQPQAHVPQPREQREPRQLQAKPVAQEKPASRPVPEQKTRGEATGHTGKNRKDD